MYCLLRNPLKTTSKNETKNRSLPDQLVVTRIRRSLASAAVRVLRPEKKCNGYESRRWDGTTARAQVRSEDAQAASDHHRRGEARNGQIGAAARPAVPSAREARLWPRDDADGGVGRDVS